MNGGEIAALVVGIVALTLLIFFLVYRFYIRDLLERRKTEKLRREVYSNGRLKAWEEEQERIEKVQREKQKKKFAQSKKDRRKNELDLERYLRKQKIAKLAGTGFLSPEKIKKIMEEKNN